MDSSSDKNSDTKTESLLEFPCDFPLKIMGRRSEKFHALIMEIVDRHASGHAPPTTRPSRDNKYIALSFVIKATSREQLDALYNELTEHDLVLFAL